MLSTFFSAFSLLLLLVGKASAQVGTWTLTMEMDPDHCENEAPSVVPITIKWYDQDLDQISWFNEDGSQIDITTNDVELNCQSKTWSISTLSHQIDTTVRNVIISTDSDQELLVFKSLILEHGDPADDRFPKLWDNMVGLGSFCLSKDDNDFIDSQSLPGVRSACQPSIEFYGERFYYNVFLDCKSVQSSTQDTITLELYDKQGNLIQEKEWAEWDTYCNAGSEWVHRTVGLTFSHHIYGVKLRTSGTDELYLDTISFEKAENVDVGVATPKNKVTWGKQGDIQFSFCMSTADEWLNDMKIMCRSFIRLCVQDCSSETAKISYADEQCYKAWAVFSQDVPESRSTDMVTITQYGESHQVGGNVGSYVGCLLGRPDYAVMKTTGSDAALLDRINLQRLDIAFPVNADGGVSNTVVHDFLSGHGGNLGKYLCLSTDRHDYTGLGRDRVCNSCLESFTFQFPWSSPV